MGTSTHNVGQKGGTPLVPSWLQQLDENMQNETPQGINGNQIPPIGDWDRFTAPRNEFTRYINAGAFASGGTRAVEQYLSIENLSHKTASDAFIAITDFICPDGGPQDEGIARSAYISAIEESPEIASIKFEDLTAEQIMVIVERTMANAIFSRITNDIGNKIILLPQDRTTSDWIIVQMKEYVKGAVSDALANLDVQIGNIRQGDSLRIVDQVYKEAFDIMVSAGENE